MAFGSFSTPSVDTKNIAGYNTPQALFADVPSSGPGGVTSNVVASMPIEGMDIQDQAAAYALQQRMKADRKAEWAEAAAKNRARMRAKKPQGPSEQDRLRAAFNEVYAPQIRSQSHDRAFTEPTKAGENLRRQYGHVGQYPGGYFMSSGKVVGSPQADREANVPYMGKGENYVNDVLNQMWRMKTDPYLRAAQSMGGIGV